MYICMTMFFLGMVYEIVSESTNEKDYPMDGSCMACEVGKQVATQARNGSEVQEQFVGFGPSEGSYSSAWCSSCL